jgi:hypothetical protein
MITGYKKPIDKDDWGDWDKVVAAWQAGQLDNDAFIKIARDFEMDIAAEMMVLERRI